MTRALSLVVRAPQAFVDAIGMYRTVTLALLGLLICSLTMGALGQLAYDPLTQLVAAVPAVLLALSLNVAVASCLKVSANHESAIITALILFFLVIPEPQLADNWALYAATAIAIFSKFFIVYKKQHIFNAAALGALVMSFPGWYEFSWWVSNPALFIPILILGSLVVMKVRKWTPVLWFIGVGLLVFLFEEWRFGVDVLTSFTTYFLSWPTLFLAFFMLTEPFTMPSTKQAQAWYGAVVGALSNTTIFLPFFAMSPELALIIGNLVMYPFRLRQKLFLELEEKRMVAKDTFEFVFKKPAGFSFKAGQYLEWMLPHKASDHGGIRRYFTIASSPTESVVRVAMKIGSKASSYKQALQQLDIGQVVIASQRAGDFLLPKDASVKLGFIAGGIGVTPFVSHVNYMLESDRVYNTALYYCVNTKDELAYAELWQKAARKFAFTLVTVGAQEKTEAPDESGFLTEDIIRRRTPDYRERIWYISGPPRMVHAYQSLLKRMGVKDAKIKTDFFPGTV